MYIHIPPPPPPSMCYVYLRTCMYTHKTLELKLRNETTEGPVILSILLVSIVRWSYSSDVENAQSKATVQDFLGLGNSGLITEVVSLLRWSDY